MKYIEPHAHMVSRTTADYEAMALAGCQVISEPAFWAGYDRSSEQGFHDYFSLLTGFEPQRAAKFGIQHYTWMCINPKESEDMSLANAVIDLIPEFLKKDNVLGIGEIGNAQASPFDLVRVGWADAASGGADLAISARRLLAGVKDAMVGQHQVCSLADG